MGAFEEGKHIGSLSPETQHLVLPLQLIGYVTGHIISPSLDLIFSLREIKGLNWTLWENISFLYLWLLPILWLNKNVKMMYNF